MIDPEKFDSVDLEKYGKTLMFFNEYEGAGLLFNRAAGKDSPGETGLKKNIYSCEWAQANRDSSALYALSKTNFNPGGESFGIQFYRGGVVYAAPVRKRNVMKTNGKIIREKKGSVFKDLVYADFEPGALPDPKLFSKHLRSDFHTGGVCFSNSEKTIYFTETIPKDTHSVLKIFRAQLIDGKWRHKRELNFNSDNYSCAHPALSPDEAYLYFSSDMPGGYGGKDLYRCEKADSGWGSPINLGSSINTPGDEMFPYLYRNHVLFFTSNGYVGYGGLDIFSSVYKGSAWNRIRVEKRPLNSSADDFALVFNPRNEHEILFSSNRDGNGTKDGIFYIYKYPVPADTISGQLYDELTENPIDGAFVYAIDRNTSDTLASTKSDKDGKFKMIIPPADEFEEERDLALVIKREGYEPTIIDIDDGDFDIDRPDSKKYDISVKKEIQENQVLLFHNIYFEKDKAVLTDKAKEVLHRIIRIMDETPEISIELSAHTDCLADSAYNMDLSERRAQNAKRFLIMNGIDETRIIAKGYGETRPLNHCVDGVECSEAEHAENRRIEIRIKK